MCILINLLKLIVVTIFSILLIIISSITSLNFIYNNIRDKEVKGTLKSDFIEAVWMYSMIAIDALLIIGFINLIFN